MHVVVKFENRFLNLAQAYVNIDETKQMTNIDDILTDFSKFIWLS